MSCQYCSHFWTLETLRDCTFQLKKEKKVDVRFTYRVTGNSQVDPPIPCVDSQGQSWLLGKVGISYHNKNLITLCFGKPGQREDFIFDGFTLFGNSLDAYLKQLHDKLKGWRDKDCRLSDADFERLTGILIKKITDIQNLIAVIAQTEKVLEER